MHGGRWRAGNRTDASSIKVAQWANFGFFAMSIDYRLVGGSPAPASYLDTLCAIRWVHAHAQEYKIDPERVYLIGQSAGGQLVSLVATLGDGPFEAPAGGTPRAATSAPSISVAGAVRAQHAVVGQSLDAGGRGRRSRAQAGVADRRT